jgi:hypothetical protein
MHKPTSAKFQPSQCEIDRKSGGKRRAVMPGETRVIGLNVAWLRRVCRLSSAQLSTNVAVALNKSNHQPNAHQI